MDVMKMIEQRHSVRKYLDKPIEGGVLQQLLDEIERVNTETGLCFSWSGSNAAVNTVALRAIGWRNAQGVIVCAGPTAADLDERIGYWGEYLVLFCQHLGLNTCWAGMARQKKLDIEFPEGIEYVISIGVGYGADQGRERKSKSFDQVTKVSGDTPDWFVAGVRSALLAPTAVNQQKFNFKLTEDGGVVASAPSGNMTYIDLGIVAYHFEAAAGVKVEMAKA